MTTASANKKFIVDTNKAPRAIGPYSQAVGYGGLLFVSGQIPIDPDTGEVVAGSVEVQTRRVMNNLQGVLMAAGLDFSHVLKTTVYLRNMNDYALVNEVYALYFDHSPPARVAVEVSRLPKDVLVEIDAIAATPTDYAKVAAPTEEPDTPLDHPGPDAYPIEVEEDDSSTPAAESEEPGGNESAAVAGEEVEEGPAQDQPDDDEADGDEAPAGLQTASREPKGTEELKLDDIQEVAADGAPPPLSKLKIPKLKQD